MFLFTNHPVFVIISASLIRLLNSVVKNKKHLSLQPLIDGFKTKFGKVDDNSRAESVHYDVLDTALSGLACMFYKSGDMATYQQRMKLKYYKNNFENHFGIR